MTRAPSFARWVAATVLVMIGGEMEAVHAEGLPRFPQAWHGIWWAGTDECFAKDFPSEGLFKISGDKLEAWETVCWVKRAASKENDVTHEVDLTCSGEGEEWQSTELWSAAEIDGKKLLVMVDLGGDVDIRLYRRCQ